MRCKRMRQPGDGNNPTRKGTQTMANPENRKDPKYTTVVRKSGQQDSQKSARMVLTPTEKANGNAMKAEVSTVLAKAVTPASTQGSYFVSFASQTDQASIRAIARKHGFNCEVQSQS